MLKRIAKRIVPVGLHPASRRIYSRFRAYGWKHRCPLCNSRLRQFRPHGTIPDPNCVCPVCHCKAPHRLAWLWFSDSAELFKSGGLCVHVAPERELGRLLSAKCRAAGMTYRSGNLSGTGQQHMDILELPFENRSVDLFYCCHVLNSLREDRRAMREVLRVMRPSGTAVLQVPAFYKGETTLEAEGDEGERARQLGEVGIYRCYTDRDYVQRLYEAGWSVQAFHTTEISSKLVERYSLKSEVLHVCQPRPLGSTDRLASPRAQVADTQGGGSACEEV